MRFINILVVLSACASTPPITDHPVVGSYRHQSDCRIGSPENPTCTSRLTLAADGTGEFVGDDIVERVRWKRAGDEVEVAIGARTLKLHVEEDGRLVDARGLAWSTL